MFCSRAEFEGAPTATHSTNRDHAGGEHARALIPLIMYPRNRAESLVDPLDPSTGPMLCAVRLPDRVSTDSVYVPRQGATASRAPQNCMTP